MFYYKMNLDFEDFGWGAIDPPLFRGRFGQKGVSMTLIYSDETNICFVGRVHPD